MPIRPERRALYPADWRAISEGVRQRAGHRCEFCSVRNRAWGWRDDAGEFHEVAKRAFRGQYIAPPFDLAMTCAGGEVRTVRIIKIVLTSAHLNHDPSDCRDENLKALCQRCHLRYDAASKRERRVERERAAAAGGDLLEAYL
jgi:5-methylcytosine-specific restriction endonuclease McrA